MKRLTINGEDRQLGAATVAGMEKEIVLPAPLVLVEHNGLALRKSEWEDTVISDGDRFEILRVSAGG